MDSEISYPSNDSMKCGNCDSGASLTMSSSSGMWVRSVKRRYNDFERGNTFFSGGIDLYEELEEERNASTTAANEAMSMILRLQKEKAEIQMDARQFKRIAEETMAHDEQEKCDLEDLLYKIECSIHSITVEVQAYKHRIMSPEFITDSGIEHGNEELGLGVTHNSTSCMIENFTSEYDLPPHSFPPLKCCSDENPDPLPLEGDLPPHSFPPLKCSSDENPDPLPLEGDDEFFDVENSVSGETPLKYALGDTPRDHFKNFDVPENVMVGYSPRNKPTRFSTDNSNLFTGPDMESPRPKTVVSQVEDLPYLQKKDNLSESGDNDQVYSLDCSGVKFNDIVHPTPVVGIYEAFTHIPRHSLNQPDMSDPGVKNLYVRLQALEADRESMTQTILAMRSDEKQMELLKEIAQRLRNKENNKMAVRKLPIVGNLSLMTVLKVILSASCIKIFLVRS